MFLSELPMFMVCQNLLLIGLFGEYVDFVYDTTNCWEEPPKVPTVNAELFFILNSELETTASFIKN